MIGRYPVRANPYQGLYVKDGRTTKYDWLGFVPPELRLNIHDPDRGYIITANNKPAGNNYLDGNIDLSIYTARANRIEEIIQQKIPEHCRAAKRPGRLRLPSAPRIPITFPAPAPEEWQPRRVGDRKPRTGPARWWSSRPVRIRKWPFAGPKR